MTSRTGVLFRGPYGWGEFSPFADYNDERSALWLQAALEAAYLPISVPDRAHVLVNAIIGDSEDPREATHRALHELGCTTIKIKLGSDLQSDIGKLEAIAAEVSTAPDPQSVKIRVDINGRWNLEQAINAFSAMRDFPIEYVEQPCSDRESLVALRERVDIPIAVDESIRIDQHDNVRDFADIAILKVSPSGGLRATRDIAARLNMPVRISGALETSIGLFPSLVAAWELAPDYAAGLGTGVLFSSDLVPNPLIPVHGKIPVTPIEPDPESLERHTGDAELQAGWRERFNAAYALLPPQAYEFVASSF